AERVAAMIGHLAKAFRPPTVNVLVGHIMMSGALVGPGGGERPLHLGDVYAVDPQRLPSTAGYIALGHLHRPQEVTAPATARYAGSLLQLDFGEQGQPKSVAIVDAHPGQPPQVELVPITAGRGLRDMGGTLAELPRLAGQVGDDYLRVTVHVEHPVPGLAEQVREVLPNAVAVEAKYPHAEPREDSRELGRLTPEELLQRYYRQVHGGGLPQPLLALFRRLQEEVYGAAP
ncbi:MAG: exonuclease SbcCD subunit D, partial [Dehalococcoidia bacterium]